MKIIRLIEKLIEAIKVLCELLAESSEITIQWDCGKKRILKED